MTTNYISLERRVIIGCSQESCCGPGSWNLLYNSIFKRKFTRHTNVIAFADDVIILTKRQSSLKAENYMNLELRKISDWHKRTN